MDLCIYHGNCVDGFGAAWVVRKALGNIQFHKGSYGDDPPDVTGKCVVMVDFSYSRQVLLAMAAKAHSILIIDHHKTAMENLVDLPSNVITIFDMNHSGAMLTWLHFFASTEPPKLLRHIEDRDLWRFAIPGTRQVQANLFSFPYDFEVWDTLMAADTEALAVDGKAIERKHQKDLSDLLPLVTRYLFIGGHTVPAANLPPTMGSDAGNELANGHAFAAVYYDTPNGRTFSLRSNKDGIDVAQVAQLYGGGGHRNASGFHVSFAKALDFEIDL